MSVNPIFGCLFVVKRNKNFLGIVTTVISGILVSLLTNTWQLGYIPFVHGFRSHFGFLHLIDRGLQS